MNEAEKRAVVRHWNLIHGWHGDKLDRGHDAMLDCAAEAHERAMHRTGCAELLDYYGRGAD